MYNTLNESIDVDVTISSDNILELKLGGNISSDLHATELKKWVADTIAATTEIKQRQSGIAHCITDISALTEFDEGTLVILKELLIWPENRDVKTAVLGGSLFSNMALKTLIVLSGRDNIKPFDSRSEALEWLLEK